MSEILWSCVYCWGTEYDILNKENVNWWVDFVQSRCCGRRYSLNQLYIENPEDNVNEDQDQIDNWEVKGIIN